MAAEHGGLYFMLFAPPPPPSPKFLHPLLQSPYLQRIYQACDLTFQMLLMPVHYATSLHWYI